jgi:hypothetical protein
VKTKSREFWSIIALSALASALIGTNATANTVTVPGSAIWQLHYDVKASICYQPGNCFNLSSVTKDFSGPVNYINAAIIPYTAEAHAILQATGQPRLNENGYVNAGATFIGNGNVYLSANLSYQFVLNSANRTGNITILATGQVGGNERGPQADYYSYAGYALYGPLIKPTGGTVIANPSIAVETSNGPPSFNQRGLEYTIDANTPYTVVMQATLDLNASNSGLYPSNSSQGLQKSIPSLPRSTRATALPLAMASPTMLPQSPAPPSALVCPV